MSQSNKEIAKSVSLNIARVEQLLSSKAILLEHIQHHAINTEEVASATAELPWAFYMDARQIFASIASGLDESVPDAGAYGREFLMQMTRSTNRRGAVISMHTAEKLTPYLEFYSKWVKHMGPDLYLFGHTHSFLQDRHELLTLAISLHDVWEQTKKELLYFANTL